MIRAADTHLLKGILTVKIEAMSGDLPQPFAYGNIFTREEVGGLSRLRVGVDEAQDAVVAALAAGLRGPFQLLYVLHTSRTGAELGGYESPEVTLSTVRDFCASSVGFCARIRGTTYGSVRMTTMRQSCWIDTI